MCEKAERIQSGKDEFQVVEQWIVSVATVHCLVLFSRVVLCTHPKVLSLQQRVFKGLNKTQSYGGLTEPHNSTPLLSKEEMPQSQVMERGQGHA